MTTLPTKGHAESTGIRAPGHSGWPVRPGTAVSGSVQFCFDTSLVVLLRFNTPRGGRMRSFIVSPILALVVVLTAFPARAGGGRSRLGVNSGYSADGKLKRDVRKFNRRHHRHDARYKIR